MNGAKPITGRNVEITDKFWKEKQLLIKNEVIPYQYELLCDNVEGAEKSHCISNFKKAANAISERKAGTERQIYPTDKWHYTEDNADRNSFLGWVFQDTDLYKWIEAVANTLIHYPDKELEALADNAIKLIADACEDDGYIDTLYTINNPAARFTNLRDHHELYCFGHLALAATAYYNATGKKLLLDTACRFADLICDIFGEGKKEGYDGHPIAEEAFLELYDAVKDEKYLKQAELFIERRGRKPYYFDTERGAECGEKEIKYIYNQAHLPIEEQNEAVGHAVRAVYLYTALAHLAYENSSKKMLNKSIQLFKDITERKMYITGGIGSTPDGEAFTFAYDLPNDLAYSESCASIGLTMFARRLLQSDFNSVYADTAERCLYNCILAGIALDGKSFFYVNPLEVDPVACKGDSRKHHIKPVRQKWFGCACCPPNIARIISGYSDYCATENDSTVFINLYQECKIKSSHADIEIDGNYLKDGEMKIKFKIKRPFTLALRIPSYSKNAVFSVNNPYIKNGYAYFEICNDGEITAKFNPEITITASNPLVRENAGRVAVTRGPVVYCLEEVDNGKYLHLLRLSHHPKFSFDDENITANVYRKEINTQKLYYEYSAPQEKLQRLKFIPYYKWANRGENEMSVYISY
ncbi:MAG: glycoside hydrolase family 127 protein [Eubacterium sp.]